MRNRTRHQRLVASNSQMISYKPERSVGGLGSGRRTSRVCTDQLLSLDIRQLVRQRAHLRNTTVQVSWEGKQSQTVLEIRSDGEALFFQNLTFASQGREPSPYEVRLDLTGCNFGGSRAWFRCPNTLCGRRVAILYGGDVFLCRQCWSADYRSQRESVVYRLFRRIYKLRSEMGWKGPCSYGVGSRPKYMSRQQYDRNCIAHHEMTDEIDMLTLAMLDRR